MGGGFAGYPGVSSFAMGTIKGRRNEVLRGIGKTRPSPSELTYSPVYVLKKGISHSDEGKERKDVKKGQWNYIR